jgi:hypothetical protein
MGRKLEEINFNLIQFLQTIEIIFLLDNNQKPIDNIPYPYISIYRPIIEKQYSN